MNRAIRHFIVLLVVSITACATVRVLPEADAAGAAHAVSLLRRRLVGEGQLVDAGTVIAELGRAGATRDMLHFELRCDDALVDPLKYLPRRWSPRLIRHRVAK